MTRKERFARALRCEEVDRLPFWVKIFSQDYLAAQEQKYRKMGELALADHLDLDHMAGGGAPVACTNDKVQRTAKNENGRLTTVSKTPDGTLTAVDAFDPGSQSWHPSEFPIKTRSDLKAARHLFAHNRFEINRAQVPKCVERIAAVGDRGVVLTGMGISPLMNLIQHLIGPMNTHYFLVDYPDEMDELISVMHEERLRFLRCLLEDCPYDYIVSVENTSTTLLSPRLFERYCWRHLNDYGRVMQERGKRHILHMCGHLKALLPRINQLPAIAIEAYTSPPVGNTTLADRVRLSPRIAVIGGTNAALWLRPVAEICAEIEKSIRDAGTTRGLILTSAGVMPPAASIEKIRQVRDFAKRFKFR